MKGAARCGWDHGRHGEGSMQSSVGSADFMQGAVEID